MVLLRMSTEKWRSEFCAGVNGKHQQQMLQMAPSPRQICEAEYFLGCHELCSGNLCAHFDDSFVTIMGPKSFCNEKS